MLERLRIRDLALLEAAEVEFRPGLNVVTGETGAGKSLLVQAVALLVLAIFLLFFISMTSVFLLRVFFASRRAGRGRTYGATAAPLTMNRSPYPASANFIARSTRPSWHDDEVPSASHTLEWMWQLEPTLSKAYLAMKVMA